MDASDKAFHKGMDADNRIAINIVPDNFLSTVYSGIHEAGHAIHHQHRPVDWFAQPVGTSGDFCIREAMAFIWQYYTCREPQFIEILAAETSAIAGEVVTADDLWPSVNQSRPSVLRNGHGDANYMAHILIRYEMERDLINGVIEAEDVPSVWNKKIKDCLGLDVPDDGQGCLQDIHWYKGSFGYFPCYALAHFYAAQLFDKARTTIADFPDRFLADNAAVMTEFLAWNVYSKANSAPGLQIIESALGAKLDARYFINRLKQQG
jgi:carboxypeptidase Taq